jgi:hypothetical protein
MTKINELPIVQNGQYRNINLTEMGNGEVVELELVFDSIRRVEKSKTYPGTGGKPDKTVTYWMCQTKVKYNNEDVGLFMPAGYSADQDNQYISAETYADMFDNAGTRGDKIRVVCKKDFVKDKDGKEIAGRSFIIEKI